MASFVVPLEVESHRAIAIDSLSIMIIYAIARLVLSVHVARPRKGILCLSKCLHV